MIEPALQEALREAVFGRGNEAVYAVLDGAMVDGLPRMLQESGCEYSCLFSGLLDPMLEDAAPYVVRLSRRHAFTDLILGKGWNSHWGIVLWAAAGVDLYAVRQHLRKHLRVIDAQGNPMFFRFYDPRAFRLVIPQLERAARREFFGPLSGFMVEAAQADALLAFEAGGPSGGRQVALVAAAANTA